jgi:C-terminal peptidase prc
VPRTRTLSGGLGIGVTVLAALAAHASPAHAAPFDDSDQLRRNASDSERLGQWERACDLYVRLLADDRTSTELRDRLRQCVRHLQQARRHRDPLYRDRVQSLSLTQALATYVEALDKLQSLYVDREKVAPDQLFRQGFEEFRRALADDAFRQAYSPTAKAASMAVLGRLMQQRWGDFRPADAGDARRAVREAALEAQRSIGVNPAVVVLEFVCGACNGLDEYSLFVSPGSGADEVSALTAELASFGFQIGWADRQFVVERIVPGSWAASAGIQPGDRILRVGKMAPDRLSAEAVAELLRGEPAWLTELEVQSPDEPTSHTLRLPTTAPSILEAEMVRDPDHPERTGIGYIRLISFQRTTLPELDSAVLRLRSGGLRVLILDLRGNPGGSFPAAVQVAERFLSQGVIVLTHGQVRTFNRTYTATNQPPALDTPLVVLIDGETASAAEVVAGALKDNQRATLVGQPTYGKGSVQCLLQLQAGGGVRLTLAKLFSPRGQPLTGAGVTPNYLEPLPTRQLDVAYEQAVRLLGMKP